MRLQNIPFIVALAGLACVNNPAAAAPWSRGFVVATYEYAFRYGGRASFTRAGEIEPGVDCPHGSSTHFANENETPQGARAAEMARPAGSQQHRATARAGPGARAGP